jgi:predicted GTPase
LILEQTREAIKTASIAILVTDFKTGIVDWDLKISRFLIENEIPCLHLINKCDKLYDDEDLKEVNNTII